MRGSSQRRTTEESHVFTRQINTRDKLRDYLFKSLIPTPAAQWPADDVDLLDRGLDSLRVMQLLVFIEREMGVNLPDHELTPERVGSVAALSAWIDERRR